MSSPPGIAGRLVSDLVRTILRWRDADYRLLFGGFVVLALLGLRLGALAVDGDNWQVYKPVVEAGGYSGSTSRVSPNNCTAAPGYLLGTDRHGRSLALTLVESTEVFFLPALFSCAIAIFLGTILGALAGYFRGGILEGGIKLILTVLASYPRLIMVIVAVGLFVATREDPGRDLGLRLGMIATFLGLSYTPVLALAIYQKVGSFQREQFVEAARAHGLGHTRILGYHILWANCSPVVLRHFFYLFGYFILVETSLSFLGGHYGVPASDPSWGNLVTGCDLGSLFAPAFVAPATAIVVSILGLTLLGDAIGDRFERGRT